MGVRVAPAGWLVGVARDFMNITFNCASCGTRLRAAAEQTGKRVMCPDCREAQFVPTDETRGSSDNLRDGANSNSKTLPGTGRGYTIPDEVLCPICWLVSDLGELMHISVDNELKGDSILGADQQQRFLATRFNDLGQALDPSGFPCSDLACPHCRRKLPSGFLETSHRIISLVGDQSAGKSYFLAVLAKVLPATLFRNFNVTFQDGDPQGNAKLNEMKIRLFGARTPQEARFERTEVNGSMYDRLPRRGKQVLLPKPFTYTLGSDAAPDGQVSLVFYDNSGENFQPGYDINEYPGAQHVASASGILFLFDPFNSDDFRKRLRNGKDPQLENPTTDQQAIILSEMRSRIQKLRHLRSSEKIDTPLAMLIGKCDAWMHLLGENALQNPIRDGWLDSVALQHNSRVVRSLLMEICPSVVGNAESLSKEVLFFAVSSFGHTPVQTVNEKTKARHISPDPTQLRPIFVEVPVLWLLSKFCQHFVPISPSAQSQCSSNPQTAATPG